MNTDVNMKPNIGLFTEGTATSSFRRVLSRMFEDVTVRDIVTADLENEHYVRSFDLLVFPGIASEESPYPSILSGPRLENVLSAVQDGSILWASCAAAYFLAEQIEYHASNGELKTRAGLGLFPGKAVGPVDRGRAVKPEEADRLTDVRCVPVGFTVRSASGEFSMNAALPYGNGPALVGKPEGLDVIARYTNGNGIAIAHKSEGNGMITFSGPLVELGVEEAAGNSETAIRLRHELAPGEDARKMLALSMRARFIKHIITRRRHAALCA